MKSFSLFEQTTTFGGVYVTFLVNRLQMLYLTLMMPMYLLYPSMILAIVGIGILSQLNLMMLAKFFDADVSAKGYPGFVELFGRRLVRIFAGIGVIFLFVKCIGIIEGYVEIVHQVVFPSMNSGWLIVFSLLISCYVAAHGLEKTLRFVVIIFFSTIWVIFLFYNFLIPPIASLHDLFPLIPTEWSPQSWKGLLLILSSLSGPEYLICFARWIRPKEKIVKYFTIANTITILEYLVMFISTLLFYGSNYMNKINYPVVNMIQYIQSPLFERVDILLISTRLFHFVYSTALFLLCLYGGIRIVGGRGQQQTTRIGFLACCMTLFIGALVASKWLLNTGPGQQLFLNVYLWFGACSFVLVPLVLLMAIRRRGRV